MKFQSDSFYIDKVLNNNVNAYASLVDKHKDMVFTIALRIVRNREDAEEIAQDVFVKVYQALATFKKESKFSTWLYRIVYNTAISKTRKKQFETTDLNYEIVENYSEDDINEDLNRLDNNEQKKVINTVLKKLNPEDHMLVTLYYFKEYSTEEISEIVNISQSNVKVKLHRIRKKLYGEIQKFIKSQHKEIYL
jgi:RNA polymerase sigma-70 factor (ECF subfamily)